MPRTPTCQRCGRPVQPGQYLCDQCREEAPVPVVGGKLRAPRASPELEERRRRWPPGMGRPSPVQYHATVMVTIFLVLAGLAAFAFLSHQGIGPFNAKVTEFHLAPGNQVAVTMTVINQGKKSSRATCDATALDVAKVSLGDHEVLTPVIPPGGSVVVHDSIAGIAEQPASVKVTCS